LYSHPRDQYRQIELLRNAFGHSRVARLQSYRNDVANPMVESVVKLK
jgi:hypothetical protein